MLPNPFRSSQMFQVFSNPCKFIQILSFLADTHPDIHPDIHPATHPYSHLDIYPNRILPKSLQLLSDSLSFSNPFQYIRIRSNPLNPFKSFQILSSLPRHFQMFAYPFKSFQILSNPLKLVQILSNSIKSFQAWQTLSNPFKSVSNTFISAQSSQIFWNTFKSFKSS